MSEILTGENIVALLTLTSLEIVLGIDNVVLIAVMTSRLRPEQQGRARRVGMLLAMVMRILLLLAIGWVMRLKEPLFHLFGQGFSGQQLILLGGGLFLIAKATHEIHAKLEGEATEVSGAQKVYATMTSIIAQILMLDLVFSLDSVITAVGMAREVSIMIIAVITSVGIMLAFSGPISGFIMKHPTIKMLALSFLLLIGVILVAEGFGRHVEKGYVYFAMGFSLLVEMLNLKIIKHHSKPPEAMPEVKG